MIYPPYISVPKFISYTEARKSILNWDDSSSEDLQAINENAVLRLHSRANGSSFVQTGHLQTSERADHIRPEAVVQEYMIAANSITAEYCHRNGIPVIFTSQRWDSTSTTAEAIQEDTTPFLHDPLNLRCYTHMTSPLRRTSNLLAHFQVKPHLRSDALASSDGKVVQHISERKRVRTSATNFVKDRERAAKAKG